MGAYWGLPPELARPFIESLRASGFDGRIVFVVTRYSRQDLARLGTMVDELVVVPGPSPTQSSCAGAPPAGPEDNPWASPLLRECLSCRGEARPDSYACNAMGIVGAPAPGPTESSLSALRRVSARPRRRSGLRPDRGRTRRGSSSRTRWPANPKRSKCSSNTRPTHSTLPASTKRGARTSTEPRGPHSGPGRFPALVSPLVRSTKWSATSTSWRPRSRRQRSPWDHTIRRSTTGS